MTASDADPRALGMTSLGRQRGRLATAEFASPGHPDKIADQIADSIVDAMLEQDPDGRCGCEVLVNASLVVVSGEFKTSAQIDPMAIVKDTLRSLGYDDPELGFSADEPARLPPSYS